MRLFLWCLPDLCTVFCKATSLTWPNSQRSIWATGVGAKIFIGREGWQDTPTPGQLAVVFIPQKQVTAWHQGTHPPPPPPPPKKNMTFFALGAPRTFYQFRSLQSLVFRSLHSLVFSPNTFVRILGGVAEVGQLLQLSKTKKGGEK